LNHQILQFSSVSILPPMLRTHLHLNTILVIRTSGRCLESSEQSVTVSGMGKQWQAKWAQVVSSGFRQL